PADQPAHAPPQLRHAHARRRGRHPRGAGTARPQEPDDDPGVHARDDAAAPGQLQEGPSEGVRPSFVAPASRQRAPLRPVASPPTRPPPRGFFMRVPPFRPAVLLPLVTAAALTWPARAPAADPVNWRTDYNAARKEATEKGLPLFVVVGTDNCFYCRKL